MWETGSMQGLALLPVFENVFTISAQKRNEFVCELLEK